MRRFLSLPLAAALVGLAACEQAPEPTSNTGPLQLRVEVLAELPHDPGMFTQGLEIADGILYEGSGKVGESRLRATRFPGGEQLREVALPETMFGEGITVVGDRIWQLTWTDGWAFERDRHSLAELRRVPYPAEGWGICHTGTALLTSDGSSTLTARDPDSLAALDEIRVTDAEGPVEQLNELECVDGAVWANVWRTDRIVRIDPTSGEVTGDVDASGLLSPAERAGADVLNGIAAIPGTDEFVITGKYWPTMFRVRFVPE